MTDKPRVPADDARAEGRQIVAPVTHTFGAGYRAPLAVVGVGGGTSARWKLDKADLARCSHCGMPEDHRYHGSIE